MLLALASGLALQGAQPQPEARAIEAAQAEFASIVSGGGFILSSQDGRRFRTTIRRAITGVRNPRHCRSHIHFTVLSAPLGINIGSPFRLNWEDVGHLRGTPQRIVWGGREPYSVEFALEAPDTAAGARLANLMRMLGAACRSAS